MTHIVPAALPDDAPAGLRDSLASRGANVTRIELDPPKTYVWAAAAGDQLFAWYSRAPGDAAVLSYELAVRETVGTELPLRSQPVLDHGALWRLERAVDPEPVQGRSAVLAVAEALEALGELQLPESPPSVGRERVVDAMGRRWRVLRCPLSARDFVRAKLLLARSRLPRSTSHGDFHRKHVLLEGGRPWVLDWELSARRPAGFDLMTMWADLERDEDRELLFEEAVRIVGPKHERGLLELRYAVLVLAIATKFVEPAEHNRDVEGGRALLPLLPLARSEASAG